VPVIASAATDVVIDGQRLRLTNLDKVLYPAVGFTKAQVIDYYRRIAPVMLPHLAGKPPTMVRAPDGVGGEQFFEKRCPPHHPQWVATAPANGYVGCVIDSLPALVWTANLAALELHTQQATTAEPERPTALVVDLDPGPGAGLADCRRVALQLRDWLARLDLVAVVKTSGSKGLHLSVPLNTPAVTDDDTKRFALTLGQLLEQREPERVTTNMAKDQRHGRVFVDWSQNDRHKTTIAPYSLRIRDRPTVSTPLTWEEVEAGDQSFEADEVVARVERIGDAYLENLTRQQELPKLA
jgi:bifunctional non-homologous end joining protein LigD